MSETPLQVGGGTCACPAIKREATITLVENKRAGASSCYSQMREVRLCKESPGQEHDFADRGHVGSKRRPYWVTPSM